VQIDTRPVMSLRTADLSGLSSGPTGTALPLVGSHGPRSLGASSPVGGWLTGLAGVSALAVVPQTMAGAPPSGGGGPRPSMTPVGIATWPQFS
jgi:hypothetical protein